MSLRVLGPKRAFGVVGASLALALGFAPAARADEPSTRIVGGDATTIAEWPWQVAVADADESVGNGFDRQFCGGTLVAANLVVSAAHCFYDILGGPGEDDDNDFDDPSLFAVFTGRTNLSNGAEGQEIDVNEIYVAVDSGSGPTFAPANAAPASELYNPDTSEWDVVYVELVANSASTPIKIAGADEAALWEPGREAFITGWGNRAAGGIGSDYPDNLHEAQIHMISDSFCSSPTSYGFQFVAETMVCAGEETGGRDTCQGDSGGPLVVPTSAGEFRLVGDTSWGIGCALPNFPGIYGRLAADPIRTALANSIQANFGVSVLGSGATPPVEPPPPPVVDTDCENAKKKVKKAKRKLKRAKQDLREARREDAGRKQIDRAENRVQEAKRKLKRAKKKRNQRCD